MNDDRLFIIGVEVENFKRIDLVKIIPNETGITIIGGDNAQGKSSLIDATMATLAGKKAFPDRPLKDGAERGHAIVDLSNGLVIERTFNKTKSGGDLFVKTKEGHTLKGGQGILDDPFGGIGFDPVKFIKVDTVSDERKQMQQLKDAVGLDFAELDQSRDALYNKRADVNKDITLKYGELAAIPIYPDAPETEMSIKEFSVIYDEALQTNEYIKTISGNIEAGEKRIDQCKEQIKQLDDEISNLMGAGSELRNKLATMEEQNTDSIREKMLNIEEINSQVRSNQKQAELSAELEQKKTESDEITQKIKKVDAEKRTLIENAKIPIEGLDFGERGLIYNGISLKDASSAEQITVAIRLADILSPKSRVILIREGSNLDPKMLRFVAEIARKRGLQVIMERVSHNEEDKKNADYVIENGKVRGAAGDPPTPTE